MILCPDERPEVRSNCLVSAWEAVAATQCATARTYGLVRQPDHARLSGELACNFSHCAMFPMTDEIVAGISLHDEGWSQFDSGAQKLRATVAKYSDDGVALSCEGKPLSFLDITAGDFLHAWRASIAAAEAIAPIAALMVSGHFYRLGKFGLSTNKYPEIEAVLVEQFVLEEEGRRERLSRLEQRSNNEIEYWTDVLQFCDLLSLYMCCGSHASVEFPQHITGSGEAIRLQVQDGVNVLSPTLFASGLELCVSAQAYPGGAPETLKWKMR